MVHVPAKLRENTPMRFGVTVRKLNVTDRQTDRRTDRGHCNISYPRAYGVAGDKKLKMLYHQNFILYIKQNKRPVGLIAPPFKINFLATKY